MVSLIDFLPLYFAAACAGVAWAMQPLPGKSLRWVTAFAAAIIGWFVCRMFLNGVGHALDARSRKKLKRLSLDQLEGLLQTPGNPEMRLVLLEIKGRGVDLGRYRSYLIDLLGSENGSHRLFAFRAFCEGFPNDVDRIRGYTPYEPAEKCKKKTEPLHDVQEAQPRS